MSKKKFVPTVEDNEVVAGIGPDVDFTTLPQNIVTDAVKRQADPALLRAGVKDPFLPSEPLNKETTKTFGVPMSDRNYNKKPSPFKTDAPAVSEHKSMSHVGTVIEKR